MHGGQRAITALTVGVAKSTEKRRARQAELGLGESFQQFQVPISGTAGTLPAFTNVSVDFDYPFHYAPGQRDSDLEVPHAGFGAEADEQIMFGATVIAWVIDDGNGAYTGATVAISAMAADDDTSFTGSVHLTFQGFSAPDDTTDLTVEG